MKTALRHHLLLFALLFSAVNPARGKIPGGGDGTGPNVTLVTNSPGMVTLANGTVSILCATAGATINQINYTYNNSGTPVTTQVLSGGNNGGQLYWELGGFGGSAFVYSVVADPALTGGDYAEIDLLSTSATAGTVDIHFSMRRGSPGFYVTPIWSHRIGDAAFAIGETRDNIYSGTIFNWMSVDATRNRLMEVSASETSIAVFGAPKEVTLWTSGIYQGQYEDKYSYSADFGEQRVWGWSSVGAGGKNVGLWDAQGSVEYFTGGPMKRELMSHIGTTILNMSQGSHYGGGTDGAFAANEVWTKVYGPHFIYCNNVTNGQTDMSQASSALYTDALAQAAAESGGWPYFWFTNANYTRTAGRGAVSGTIVINDVDNPNASAAGLWVGVCEQPATSSSYYDFQKWMKNYQFWVKTDAGGNFTISNVIAGAGYTLYAFGPGAAGTFQSQALTGGSAPNTVDIPSPSFGVAVTAGATNNLGSVTWTPTRVGPTVFEIGCPDRDATEFRHGDDYWRGDLGANASSPSPIWAKFLEYPIDYPAGVTYTVGTNQWPTDWNFTQPVVTDASGNYNPSTSTIRFYLPSAPGLGAQASFYTALASDYQGPLIIQVNGNNIAGTSGYGPAYSGSGDESDTTIRQGIHGMYSDNRITFSSSFLVQGWNTITLQMRKGGYFANHAMYDYLRLEMTGYTPPPPGSVAAYAGNNSSLVSWPVTPGANTYNILRTTTSGSGYAPVATGVTGPVCGSGPANATWLDTNVANGTTYYYVAQSVNPTGASGNSPESAGVTPSGAVSSSPPAAPTGLSAVASDRSVALTWNPAAGANYYVVQRSTVVNNGAGSNVVLSLITLNNATSGASFTDTTPTDGTLYTYTVSAVNAAGAGAAATSSVADPLPALPEIPGSFAAAAAQGANTGDITLTWAVPAGAVGYILQRATSPGGPYTLLDSITETTYFDSGLNSNTTYYYRVSAVNAAGASSPLSANATTPPPAPALGATAGNAQVTLNWSASGGATNYTLQRGTVGGGPYTTVIATNALSYVNTNLANGTTYYYIVYPTGPAGQGPNSGEASATPFSSGGGGGSSGTWIDTTTTSAQSWNATVNWNPNTSFPSAVDAVATVNSGIAAAQTINLNQPITVGAMSIGASGGAFTVAGNGGTLTLDNTPGVAALTQTSVSKTNIISAAMTNVGSLVISNLSANTFTLSGNLSGAAGGVTAHGSVTLSGANTYTGGLTIPADATVLGGSTNGNLRSWGSGSILFNGGTLQFFGYGGNGGTDWGGCSNTFNVPTGQTGTIRLPPRFGYTTPFSSALTGGGTLNLTVDYVRDFFTGNWSGFTGVINVSARSAPGDFRINNVNGYANAAFFLNSGVNFYNANANGQTTDLGELGGASGATIGTGNGASTNPTWRIGARNTTNTYAGLIADSGVTSIIKTGTGNLILTGANTYSGGTTINGGELIVNNTTGSGLGTGAVNVSSGGTLAGTGVISGAVTVNNGGGLLPGSALGALTVSNTLTLASGSVTTLLARHTPPLTNSAVQANTLNEGGTLIVTNIGADAFGAGDSFPLFKAGSFSGGFAAFQLPALTGNLRWNTSALNVSGILSVIALSPPTIATAQINGSSLVLAGSGGTANWTYYVLASTNATLPMAQWTRVATNHFDGAGAFQVTNTLNPAWPQTFYGLQLP